MLLSCGRCQQDFEMVFKTVFHLGEVPLEMNLCKRCIDEVELYYQTYNIYVQWKIIDTLRAKASIFCG